MMVMLSACYSLAQDNIEMNSNFPTGYVRATMPYQFCTIDGVLFACYVNGEPFMLVRFPAGDDRQSYTIPNTVSRISRGAFQGCKNLRELVIPASVYYVGDNAFDDSSISSFRVEGADTSLSAPRKSAAHEKSRYDLAGRQLDAPSQGLNIVQMSDHSTVKTIVK